MNNINKEIAEAHIKASALTEREKAAVRSYFIEPTLQNRYTAYKIAQNMKDEEDLTQDKQNIYSNLWIKNESIKAYLFILETKFYGIRKDEEGKNDTKDTNDFDKEFEDIEANENDKDLQLKRYTDIYLNSDVPSVKIKALEKIDKLKGLYKDNEIDENKKVIFYLPLRCQDCKLFVNFKDKFRTK